VGDTWHLDELFVTISGQRQYLWRAVDQNGEAIDIQLQPRRDRHAAARLLRKLLERSGRVPHLYSARTNSAARSPANSTWLVPTVSSPDVFRTALEFLADLLRLLRADVQVEDPTGGRVPLLRKRLA
jgi:transposase-like protein